MKVAVVVLTYNRSDALAPVLRSLARQCAPDDEVVVADDGSRSEHVRAVVDAHWGFRGPAWHVWHPDVGFTAASARNMGVSRTSAPYLIFLDGDCVPQDDFLAQHRRLARRGCFVNGSRVLLSQSLSEKVIAAEVDLPGWRFADWLRSRIAGDVNKLTHLLRWPANWRRARLPFEWRGIRSCNMAIWRDDFLALDGFDERFNGWGHEDADLVLRLSHHGVRRVNGFAATEVYHLWHRENPRQNESENRQRVLQRVGTGQVKADIGLQISWGDGLAASPSVPECTLLN